MKAIVTTAYVFACVALCALFVACATSPERAAASNSLAEEIVGSLQDNVLTQDELEKIQGRIDNLRDAPGSFDWKAAVGTIAGSVLATFTGIRYMPNSFIIGKQEADHLDKAAGVK